jgi:hypothetical protein
LETCSRRNRHAEKPTQNLPDQAQDRFASL